MKQISKLGLALTMIVLTVGCADHQFSQLETTPVEDGNSVDPEKPQGPSILVLEAPNSVLGIHDEVAVAYQVVPGTAPVEKIECVWNTIKIPCSPAKDRLLLLGGKLGGQKLKIEVTDKNGLSDVKSIPWELFEKFKKEQTKFSVADHSNQVDVLFVIDNSPSMVDEQKSMAARFESFMERVKGLNWQIGITTTDPNHGVYGDGRLQVFPNGKYMLTSELDVATARDLFGKTIQRKEVGSSSEQGIRGTYRAIQRSMGAAEEIHNDFFREHSALNVVVISDENESGTQSFNKGTELQKLVETKWGSDKAFRFHSIIVRPNDTACKAAATTGEHYYGYAYYTLTKATNGVLGDLCADDYGNQLTMIGQSVVNSKTTYDLGCIPKDINGDGNPDVKVQSSGAKPVPNFVISGEQIIFSQPPPVANYTVDYFCPQD